MTQNSEKKRNEEKKIMRFWWKIRAKSTIQNYECWIVESLNPREQNIVLNSLPSVGWSRRRRFHHYYYLWTERNLTENDKRKWIQLNSLSKELWLQQLAHYVCIVVKVFKRPYWFCIYFDSIVICCRVAGCCLFVLICM